MFALILILLPYCGMCGFVAYTDPPEKIYNQTCSADRCHLQCPKSHTSCNQKCYGPWCTLDCERDKLGCTQQCNHVKKCRQICETEHCIMGCNGTDSCLQFGGTRRKWAQHKLTCRTNSTKGCEQLCNGNCTMICDANGPCKQRAKMSPKYKEVKVAISRVICKSSTACHQHCVSQGCIFHCDAPECHITTRDYAVMGFKMSSRVRNITLHCNKKKYKWNGWNTTLGYRLCDLRDVNRHAYLPEKAPSDTKAGVFVTPFMAPNRISFRGNRIPKWISLKTTHRPTLFTFPELPNNDNAVINVRTSKVIEVGALESQKSTKFPTIPKHFSVIFTLVFLLRSIAYIMSFV